MVKIFLCINFRGCIFYNYLFNFNLWDRLVVFVYFLLCFDVLYIFMYGVVYVIVIYYFLMVG